MQSDVVWGSIHEGFIAKARLTDAQYQEGARTLHVHRQTAPDGNVFA